ncbi:hypothetical protein N9B82_05320, partial [Saprospiraceae bacterium]|nr:hypothetical protein [Saprospiraceae bacterium]
MKKLLYLSAFLFITVFLSAQDCPDGSVTFTTQEEVDMFLQTYPDCKEIQGDMKIGEDISDLSSLLGITHIDGGLVLNNNTQLVDFSGLDSLVYIGKLNDFIPFIRGYGNAFDFESEMYVELPKIEERNNISLYIYNNSSLIDFSGLEKINAIDGMLWIEYNSILSNIDGLSSLETIGSGDWIYDINGHFIIKDHEYHRSDNISVTIKSNQNLLSISGLDQVKDMQGSFYLYDNS